MHPLETDSTGNLTPAELARFGGTYTFREKLQSGGTGSSKIIYQEGIPIFDELHRGIQNEVAYANFEWLKNGIENQSDNRPPGSSNSKLTLDTKQAPAQFPKQALPKIHYNRV